MPARALPDFKITDGVSYNQRFKSLTIRKTDELVGYGLGGQKRPSIQDHGGQHVEADAYHDLMKDPDAVIIDVRNAYESAVGHFAPPTGGAELIDPKMVRRRRPACVSSLSLTTVCSCPLLLSPPLSCSLLLSPRSATRTTSPSGCRRPRRRPSSRARRYTTQADPSHPLPRSLAPINTLPVRSFAGAGRPEGGCDSPLQHTN